MHRGGSLRPVRVSRWGRKDSGSQVCEKARSGPGTGRGGKGPRSPSWDEPEGSNVTQASFSAPSLDEVTGCGGGRNVGRQREKDGLRVGARPGRSGGLEAGEGGGQALEWSPEPATRWGVSQDGQAAQLACGGVTTRLGKAEPHTRGCGPGQGSGAPKMPEADITWVLGAPPPSTRRRAFCEGSYCKPAVATRQGQCSGPT